MFEGTNWALSRGAHWAVVGANGSGKTLFAEAIRGGLPRVRGEMVYGFSAGGGLARFGTGVLPGVFCLAVAGGRVKVGGGLDYDVVSGHRSGIAE